MNAREKLYSRATRNFNLYSGIKLLVYELDCFSIVGCKEEHFVELRNFNQKKESKKKVTRGGLSMLRCTRDRGSRNLIIDDIGISVLRVPYFVPIACTQLSSTPIYLQTYGRNPRIDAIFWKTIAQGRGIDALWLLQTF